MEIKFRKKLSDFDYLIMFDLASVTTGVCIFDLKNNRPLATEIIKIKGKIELPAAELRQELDNFFVNLTARGIDINKIIVSKEALPLQLHSVGAHSTIQTFIALAKSHAILDSYLYEKNIAVYDYTGIYPISCRAYFRHLTNVPEKQKIEKTDIRDYVQGIYDLEDLTLDESDSIFLAKTFIEKKWNQDIDEKCKELKKHQKTLKSDSGKKKVQEQMDLLQSYKNK